MGAYPLTYDVAPGAASGVLAARATTLDITGMRSLPRRSIVLLAVAFDLAVVAYLAFWPVPVDPVAWEAPVDVGHVGAFAVDSSLAGAERIALGDHPGPESVARDAAGRLYAATLDGSIVRLDSTGRNPTVWARTGGRALGLAFGSDGTLYVADGIRGLLAIDTIGQVTVLATQAEGRPLGFADDLDVAPDGRVYFSDASSKFTVAARADANASTLDIVEHGGHGRLLEWDPTTRQVRVIASGLQFANGVALTADARAVLLTETGMYRVVRVEVEGPARGTVTPILENLPGFPDNISRDADGRFWVALFAPRKAILDRLAMRPALRRVIVRIPSVLQPKPSRYAHLIAIDERGHVLDDRQDPTGGYAPVTDVLATDRWLYLGSLSEPTLARVPR